MALMTAHLYALGPAATVETILAALDAANAEFWRERATGMRAPFRRLRVLRRMRLGWWPDRHDTDLCDAPTAAWRRENWRRR